MFDQGAFWQDTLQIAGYGVQGEPLAYSPAGDSVVSALLLVCLVIIVPAVRWWCTTTMRRVSAIVTCLVLSLLCYLRIEEQHIVLPFIARHTVLWVAAAGFAAYYIVKALLQAMVNSVFFEERQRVMWADSCRTLTAVTGLALLPLAAGQTYFAIGVNIATIYCLAVVAVVKIWSLSRAYSIFFKGTDSRCQIILYFCALELIPPLLLVGAMVIATE